MRAVAAQHYPAAVTGYNAANGAANSAFKKVPPNAPWSADVPIARGRDHGGAGRVRHSLPPDMAADASAIVSAVNSALVRLGDFLSNPNQSTWDA